MSVLDKLLEYSDAQSLASKSASVETLSTIKPDHGVAGKDGWGAARAVEFGGESRKLEWTTQINTILVGASAAIVVELVTKNVNTSMSSGGTIIDTFTIPAAAAAGTRYRRPLPLCTILQYTAVLYRAITAKLTSAKIDSWIGYPSFI